MRPGEACGVGWAGAGPSTHMRSILIRSALRCDSWAQPLAPPRHAVLSPWIVALIVRRQTTLEHIKSTAHVEKAYPGMTLVTNMVERHQMARHRLQSARGRGLRATTRNASYFDS